MRSSAVWSALSSFGPEGYRRANALGERASWRCKGTRRAIFWEEAVDKLIELTIDDPGLHWVEHHDTVSFIFEDAILVRLKKAEMTLQTSNYPTSTAELFDIEPPIVPEFVHCND
jgi:hypothetical protein